MTTPGLIVVGIILFATLWLVLLCVIPARFIAKLESIERRIEQIADEMDIDDDEDV